MLALVGRPGLGSGPARSGNALRWGMSAVTASVAASSAHRPTIIPSLSRPDLAAFSSAASPTPATTVRLGGFSGFWGDSPEGARQLVEACLADGAPLDFLVGDYLAEVTLCILARMKVRLMLT